MQEISNSATAIQFVFRPSCSLCSHAPCPVPSPSSSSSSSPAPALVIVDVNGVVHAALRFLKNVSLSFVHRRHRSERCWRRARRSLSSRLLPFVGVVHAVLRFLKNVSLSFVHCRHRSERCWRRARLKHPFSPIHSTPTSWASCLPLSLLLFFFLRHCRHCRGHRRCARFLSTHSPIHPSSSPLPPSMSPPASSCLSISGILPPHLCVSRIFRC